MTNNFSTTSLMSAFGRAYHAENEIKPVFDDYLAKDLLSNEEYTNMQNAILNGIDFFDPSKKDTFDQNDKKLRYLVNNHIATLPLCRAAYAENALKTAAKSGTEQYVILGAGLDTFAYREKNFVLHHKVFEVDILQTQTDKIERLKRANIKPGKNVVFVEANFAKDDIGKKLKESGFDPSKKTLFSLLGVSYYLSKDEFEGVVYTLSKIMAEGSSFVFDMGDEYFFDSQDNRVKNIITLAKTCHEPMKSCYSYSEIEKMLEKYNLLIYDFLFPEDIQLQLIDPRQCDMTALKDVDFVLAVKK